MTLKLILTLFLSIILCSQIYAQIPEACETPPPAGTDDCIDACIYCDLMTDGFTGTTDGFTAEEPTFQCGTMENSQWFGFAAGSTEIEFTVSTFNCTNSDGVQVGIFDRCNILFLVEACEGGGPGQGNSDFIITATDLEIGEIYFFMVDGYAGDACDYTVTVTQGSTDPPPLNPPGPISPAVVGCESETVTFSIPPLFGASYYEWTFPDGTVVAGQQTSVNYTFGMSGQVCVQASNVCNVSEIVCITVNVDGPEAGILSVNPTMLCPGETADFSVSDYSTEPEFTQLTLITDATGEIVQIITGGSGTLSSNDCTSFQVCTYAYNTTEGTIPSIGDNINSIDCSNSSCCELECTDVSFDDSEAPSIIGGPADLVLNCFDAVPPIMNLSWTDNCDGMGNVAGTETGNADLCNGGTIIRNWTHTDACGNTGGHQQLITVAPIPLAEFENPPADISVNCDYVPVTGEALNYTNNGQGSCLITGSVTPTQSGSTDICGGTITNTWSFTDLCNNTISHIQNIIVAPAPPVTFENPPADITVECNNIPTSAPLLTYTNNAIGACLVEGSVAPVESGNADICGGTISYTWTFTDPCGNTISHIQNVTVEPTPLPTFINPPIDITTTCDNIPSNPGALQYTNNDTSCPVEGAVNPTQSGSVNECGGNIIYSWSYTDLCGNIINHVQNITVSPAPPAIFTSTLPQDITVSCDAVPTTVPALEYSNNQTGNCEIAGSIPAQQFGTYDECGGTISFNWLFTDACGRSIQHIQVITVEPAPMATFNHLPGPETVACTDVLPTPPSLTYDNGATGFCSIIGSVPGIQSGFYDACGGNITYTWIFIDNCNRTINHSQEITVEPAPDPFFLNLPPDITITCGESFPPPVPLSYSNNLTGSCENSGSINATIQVLNDLELEYSWVFTNPCNGNTISHTQHITRTPAPSIQVDPDFIVLCEGESFDLSTILVSDINNTSPQVSFHFSTPASLANQLPSTEVSPSTNTTYYVYATNQSGCSDEESFDVFVEALPNAGFDGTGEICFNTPNNINLFDYLGGTPDLSGSWTDADGAGIDVSNPFSVDLTGFPIGVYNFNYTIASNGMCPSATASVTLDLLAEINIDVLDITCTANPDFYAVTINTNGFEIFVNTGIINDIGGGLVSILEIPIDELLSIVASNPGQVDCIEVTSISPPDCDCPNVNPPTSNGNLSICAGEMIPELSVNLEPGQTANWYDAPSNGNLLASGTNTYSPTNINAPGLNIFYVEAENVTDGCLSSILTSIEFTIHENPEATDTQLNVCDDGDGLVPFDLSAANLLINSTPGINFTYYESYNDANAGINAITSPYTNTETPQQTIFVVINSVDGCTDLAEVTLNVLPLPDIAVETQDESCQDLQDGMVTINTTTGESFSLNGIDWQPGNSFFDLVSGSYTAYTEDSNGCINSLNFVINSGLNLSVNDWQITCNENGTPSNDTDDFYAVSFVINTNLGLVGSFTIDDGINQLGTFNYDELVNLEFPALGQSLSLTFIDDTNNCSAQQDLGPLNACSSDCLLSITHFELECSDNGTTTNSSDDFYAVTIIAEAINGSVNNTYNVLVDNVLSYNFPYGIASEFTLPADNTTPLITIVDNEDATCQIIQSVDLLAPCSDACIISATVSNLSCDNQGTSDNSDDDTFTFDLTVIGTNTSSSWTTDIGSFSATYNVPQMLGPFLISDGDLTFTVWDVDEPSCGTTLTIQPPMACSSCSPILDAGETELLTCIVTSVEINATSSQPGDFLWSGPNGFESTDLDITVTAAGWYYLEGNYDQNCTALDSVLILANEELPMANAGSDLTITCQSTTVNLSGAGTTTSSIINYQWLDEDNIEIGSSSEITVSEVGTYTLIITDPVNGCTASDQITVAADENLPLAEAEASSQLTCDQQTTILDIGDSSTGAHITYEWFDENNNYLGDTPQIEVDTIGTYTLIVFNTLNQCEASTFVEVFSNFSTPIAEAGNSTTLTCLETTASLNASNSSGNGPLAFQWQNENGIQISNQAITEVSQPGIYSIIVTAENGCMDTSQVEIFISNDTPIADAGVDVTINCNNLEFILGGETTSIGSDIIYNWLDENNNLIGTDLNYTTTSPGVFTLVVTNASNDCTISDQVNVYENQILPQADAGSDNTLTCASGVITIGGNATSSGANFSYEWINAVNETIGSDIFIEVTEAGTYSLIVTNIQSGCTASDNVIIGADIEFPVADAGSNSTLNCDQIMILLDGTNSTGENLGFEWFNESGNSISQLSTVEVGISGAYTLIVTNMDNGCTSADIVNVFQDNNLPQAIAEVDGILTCENLEVQLNAGNSISQSGMIAFEWYNQNLQLISTTEIVNVESPGNYTLVITDPVNGCSASVLVLVEQNILTPIADAGENEILDCATTEIILEGTGTNGSNLSYEWFDDNNISISNSPLATIQSAGLYTLVVTNTFNGCSNNSTIEVVPDNAVPIAEAGVSEVLSCIVNEVTLNGGNSSSGESIFYEWQNSSGISLGNELELLVNTPGTYTLIVTDTSNNCVAQDDVLVEINLADPIVVIDEVGTLNCVNQSLVLDASASLPIGNLSFLWLANPGNIISGAESPTAEIDEPGTYSLVLTNLNNGCTSIETVDIIEDSAFPTGGIAIPDELTCSMPTVILNGNNTSGTGNFEYFWTSIPSGGILEGETSLMPLVNQTGTYTLNILNLDNGCSTNFTIEVSNDTIRPNAFVSSEDELNCITEEIQLSGEGSSVGAEFIYEWTGAGLISGATGLTPTVNAAGDYELLVTNILNGCTKSVIITVEEDINTPTGIEFAVNPPLCFGDLGSIEIISVQGGTEPYIYSLDNGDNFYDFTLFESLEFGAYDLIIQDAIGCEYEETVIVPQPTELALNFEEVPLINLGESLQLNAMVNIPENQVDTVIWFPEQWLSCVDCLDPIVNPLHEITYAVTVIDENGCEVTDQINLRVHKDRDVYIPNIFTPNGDGINDRFMIFAEDNKIELINSFKIFDRWGELVFAKFNFPPNEPSFSWDGNLKEQPIGAAVFVYYAEITFIDGRKILLKGDVTLTR